MGGKLSKKKKGYNVNDEKAKDKDKKAEAAGTEEEGTPKENETQAAAETAEVKEGKEEKQEKEAQDAANMPEDRKPVGKTKETNLVTLDLSSDFMLHSKNAGVSSPTWFGGIIASFRFIEGTEDLSTLSRGEWPLVEAHSCQYMKEIEGH
ncbi:hypothetical protein MJT46_017144 [Ovis ammon polii x Ovis aries]|nr:hypothetical protein MJT46_017144 [Ovis ammon polii x Ovis aries]